MWNLERALAEISGLPHVSLQPAAGVARRARRRAALRAPTTTARGETRTKVLTPDTAHGTNPATVTMAGLEVVKVGTTPDGGVDLDDLRAKARRQTSPASCSRTRTRSGCSTRTSRRSPHVVHAVGRAALLRRREPQRDHGHHAAGRHGLRHRALQPAQVVHPAARRRRPGVGADRGLRPHGAVPHGPADRAATTTAASTSAATRRESIGRLRGFQGNYGVLRALLRVHPLARRGGAARREREAPSSTRTTCSHASATSRRCCRSRTASAACTSSSCRARR